MGNPSRPVGSSGTVTTATMPKLAALNALRLGNANSGVPKKINLWIDNILLVC